MARKSSADVGFVLLGGRDIRSPTTSLAMDAEALIEETTGLGDADEKHAAVGVKRMRVTQEGFFDDALNAIHDALVGMSEAVFCIGHEGNVFGAKFLGIQGATDNQYRRILSRAALHKINAEYVVTGEAEDGIVLHIHQAETASPFTGTSHDNAASSAAGGSGYLQVSALTLGGFTSATVKIRHSSDNVTFVDLVTFANVTAIPTAERVAVTGTVNRYLRVEVTWNGAGAGQSITFMAGFRRA